MMIHFKHQLQGGDPLLDANGNKRHSVMAGRPMLINVSPASSTTVMASPSSDCVIISQADCCKEFKCPVRMVKQLHPPSDLSFHSPRVDQTFCSDSCKRGVSMKKPVIRSVYRCTTPIEDGTSECTRGTRGGGEQCNRMTLPPH